MNSRSRQLLTIVALVAVIAANALANILPFNDKTTRELADQYLALFTPAPYVFGIWGVIYALLIGYAIYQALPAQTGSKLLGSLAGPFAVTCVLNGTWLLVWHYEMIVLSMIIMVGLLATLMSMYLRISRERARMGQAQMLLVALPFSVYFGWISVATIANAAALLWSLNWGAWGLSAVTWTIIMMAIAALLAVGMAYWRRDAAFAAVVIWALVGIGAKNANLVFLKSAAWLLAIVLAVAAVAAVSARRMVRSRYR